MKIPTLLVLALSPALAAGAAGADLPADVREALQSITARRAHAHVKLLAAHQLQGREPGEDGFAIAASYARAQYEAAGLTGGGDAGAMSQPFRWSHARLGSPLRLEVQEAAAGGGKAAQAFSVGVDFVPFHFSAAGSLTAPVAFAGYGIRSRQHGWDDYRGLDVRGRAVLVLRHEPRERDAKSPFDGRRSSPHAAFLAKARAAQAQGAAALLLVTDPLHHEDRKPGNSLSGWPELNRDAYAREGRPVPDARPVLEGWYDEIRIPCLHVSPRVADRLLEGSGRSLESLQRAIDDSMKPQSFALAGTTVAIELAFERRFIDTENVLARREGRDPELAREVVIVGAHLDHVGKNWRGEVHPGADDNASGSAALLEVAAAFGQLKEAPRRTVIFAHWAAEEKGLLGSTWFVRHPTVDLERIVGVVNMDMVGRNKVGELSVVGRVLAPALHGLVLQANEHVGLTLKHDAGAGAARSDNFPFLTAGVPAVSLFSGTHEDYHKPSDTPDKIVAAKLEAAARLAFLTAWLAAEGESPRPARAKTDTPLSEKARPMWTPRKGASASTEVH